jgi:hypothetical protein
MKNWKFIALLLFGLTGAGVGLWGHSTPLAAMFLGLALTTIIRKEKCVDRA